VTAHGDPAGALAIAAAGWILAGLAVMRVREGRRELVTEP
jgi:hypothetical protein